MLAESELSKQENGYGSGKAQNSYVRPSPISVPSQNTPSPTTSNNRQRRNSKSRSNPTTPNSTPPVSPRDLQNQNAVEPRARRNSRARKEDRPPSIAKWLTGIGMAKYLDRFIAEEIDVDVLDMVNESHLRLLGIPLGDRLRLCVAVSRFSDAVNRNNL